MLPLALGSWNSFPEEGTRRRRRTTSSLSAMNTTVIHAELPREFTERARSYVAEGWAADFNELLRHRGRLFRRKQPYFMPPLLLRCFAVN
jgi:hypothetical protein